MRQEFENGQELNAKYRREMQRTDIRMIGMLFVSTAILLFGILVAGNFEFLDTLVLAIMALGVVIFTLGVISDGSIRNGSIDGLDVVVFSLPLLLVTSLIIVCKAGQWTLRRRRTG